MTTLLKELRRVQQIPAQAIANKLGITLWDYIALENGERAPNTREVYDLSIIMDLSVGTIRFVLKNPTGNSKADRFHRFAKQCLIKFLKLSLWKTL